MSNQIVAPARRAASAARKVSAFTLTLLAVEFLDELAFGTREAAWPLVRRDLGLTYAEIGVLLGAPTLIANALEIPLGILGDSARRRRALVLWGGACFAAGSLLVALGHSFAAVFLALTLLSAAAGAFVGLSQAALMDAEPARREQNMARWAFAGSLGQVSGSLALSLAVARGFGWRGCFAALAVVALAVTLLTRRHYPATAARARAGDYKGDDKNTGSDDDEAGDEREDDNEADGQADDESDDDEAGGGAEDNNDEDDGARGRVGLAAGFAGAWRALRRREVLRWLALLELADLTLDGFHGFIALYFADVVGLAESRAALTVAVWTGVGLAGDFLVIPLLERVRGLSYLRASALAVAFAFPAFLLAPGVAPKLALLALLGVLNAGWYSILKAQLYAALPRRSGTVMTLHSAAGLLASLIPLGLGLFAERFGLSAMMWLLLAGPLSLLALVPRAGKNRGDVIG